MSEVQGLYQTLKPWRWCRDCGTMFQGSPNTGFCSSGCKARWEAAAKAKEAAALDAE